MKTVPDYPRGITEYNFALNNGFYVIGTSDNTFTITSPEGEPTVL